MFQSKTFLINSLTHPCEKATNFPKRVHKKKYGKRDSNIQDGSALWKISENEKDRCVFAIVDLGVIGLDYFCV